MHCPRTCRLDSSKLPRIRARRPLRRALTLCFHLLWHLGPFRKFELDYSNLNQILFRRLAQKSRRLWRVRRCFGGARLGYRSLIARPRHRLFRKIWRLLRHLALRLCRFCIKTQALRSRALRLRHMLFWLGRLLFRRLFYAATLSVLDGEVVVRGRAA